jgi:hypothetical protein
MTIINVYAHPFNDRMSVGGNTSERNVNICIIYGRLAGSQVVMNREQKYFFPPKITSQTENEHQR